MLWRSVFGLVLLFTRTGNESEGVCVCGKITKKAYVANEDYTSFYTIPLRQGCEDNQLAKECDAVKLEIEDFIEATMEHLDDMYVRFMTLVVTASLSEGRISIKDAMVLREVLENQRIIALDALTDRIHPHCADGLFTTTLYNDDAVKYYYRDWKTWNLNDVRNQMLCYSKKLLSTLQRLHFENGVNTTLRLDVDRAQYATEFNAKLEQLIAADPTGKTGLSPYTKEVMTKILHQVNSGTDIGGFGISDGRLFAATMLKRLIVEDPDVEIPTAEVTDLRGIELTNAGRSNPRCFPLASTVILKTADGHYHFRMLADLALGDEVVISGKPGMPPSTSTVIDFSHRVDDKVAVFVQVNYAYPTNENPAEEFFSVTASPDHNVEFGVYAGDCHEIVVSKSTFGKLKQTLECGEKVFIRNGKGEWMPVTSVKIISETGFIAPITADGIIAIVPPQEVQNLVKQGDLSAPDVYDLLKNCAIVSVYSAVPDSLGRAVNFVKRLLFSSSENEHGSGAGFLFDGFSRAGELIGYSIGHLVGEVEDILACPSSSATCSDHQVLS